MGTFYDEETKQCISCPVGSYQSESGQLKCSSCPVIAGRPSVTVGPGARSAADCKERCPAGKYYDDLAGLCRSCGHGFYQPNEGSFSCLLCGLGKTTRTAEAVSREECRDECGSGQQLAVEGKCEPCPRGSYRTQGVQAACQTCPVGRTTPNMGSAAIEECSLPVCEPGTYLNGTLNECMECKKGTYQSEPQQTFCIPCPPNTSTKGTAAVSVYLFLMFQTSGILSKMTLTSSISIVSLFLDFIYISVFLIHIRFTICDSQFFGLYNRITFISKLDEQRGLHESVRDERRGDALRRERVLPSDTGNQRLQVRVQAGLQRNRNRVHGRVHGLLRQRGSLPEGFAGTTVLQMQRKLHRETMHREVRILLHHGRNSRRRYFNHLRRSSRMDDLCQVSGSQKL